MKKNVISNFCKDCEAWCCYDGVFLTADDEKKIKKVVEENKDFFSFLPEDYIVDGNWENIMVGRKTNTKPKKYKSKKYPKHFNQTTCVFSVDNKCMLQELAVRKNKKEWEYKPFTCCLFPLQKREEKYFEPSAVDDNCNIGEKYPGYVSFLPCHKLKKEELKDEIDYVKKNKKNVGDLFVKNINSK